MQRRGLNHDSPFDYDLSGYDDRGYIDKQANLEDLRSRCEACAERIAAFGGELL
jgi:hypothetical protein